MTEERQYRVVVLTDDGQVASSYGDFYEDDEFTRRVLAYANRKSGGRAVLQRRRYAFYPPWETIEPTEQYPAVVVESGEVRLVAAALLTDGRYRLVREQ